MSTEVEEIIWRSPVNEPFSNLIPISPRTLDSKIFESQETSCSLDMEVEIKPNFSNKGTFMLIKIIGSFLVNFISYFQIICLFAF